MLDLLLDIGSAVADFFTKTWNAIKAIGKKVLNWIVNTLKKTLEWFKRPKTLEKLNEDQDVIAIQIQEAMNNNDVSHFSSGLKQPKHAINALYNKRTGEVVSYEHTDAIEYESMDDELKKAYNGKRMVIFD